jgi:hypothetical protein
MPYPAAVASSEPQRASSPAWRRVHQTATRAGASSSPHASDGHAGVHAEPLDPARAELSISVNKNAVEHIASSSLTEENG